MHDHEHNAGEKVVIANGPAGDRQKRSRRKGGHFAHLPHAFGEQDISGRIGEHNDRNQDCRVHLPPSAMVSWPAAIPNVVGEDWTTRPTPTEIKRTPIHLIADTGTYKK